MGTGFLIAPDLVATIAHVVADSVTLAMRTDTQTAVGEVVGIDPGRDVALVRTSQVFSGHIFSLASAEPRIGTPVGTIGFPEGLPLTFTQGTVSGLDRSIDIAGVTRTGLVQTDAALNPGNSGGPLLTVSGDVVGMVDALETDANGISFAVSSQTAKPLLDAWTTSPRPQPPATCTSPTGPATGSGVTSQTPNANSQVIVDTLTTFFNAINRADWHTAWVQYSPALQSAVSEAQLAKGDRSTYDFSITLRTVQATGPTSSTAAITFTSIQNSADGPHGDTCDLWTLDYNMVQSGDRWLIDSVSGTNGGSTHMSC